MNRVSGDAIRELVAALADVAIEADHRKAAVGMAQLAELNGHEWLRLDELARRPYWSDVADWQAVLAAGTVAGWSRRRCAGTGASARLR